MRNISILSVSGEVDLNARRDFDDAVSAAVCETRAALIVDFSSVTYLDLAGLSALFKAAHQIREQHDRLYFVIPDDAIRMVFSLSYLDRLFPVSRTLDEALALASFRPEAT